MKKGLAAIAPRYAWELAHGPIPAGMFVCHRCDNPPCVNPAHLFLGTPKDNMHDRRAKGKYARGAEHHNAKLHDHIDEIRIRYALGEDVKAIADRFGSDRTAINLIARRVTYAHLGDPPMPGEPEPLPIPDPDRPSMDAIRTDSIRARRAARALGEPERQHEYYRSRNEHRKHGMSRWSPK